MITFIESGNRIATENFETGEIYKISFTNTTKRTMCCIGIGTDFVMFQGKLPNILFCLTMGTAETVSTIDISTSGGTSNYNDLSNKPQINGIELVGNKTGSQLGLVSQSELDSKQDTLTTEQLTAVNSGITSSDVAQITTNENNISIVDITANFKAATTNYEITNVSKVYRQGNHVFGHLWVNKNSGNFDNLTIEHCVSNSIDKCAYSYPQEGFFATSNWRIENLGYVFITEDTKISVRPTATNCKYAFIKIDYCCS